MATEGFLGYFVETRNYSATAALWKSLGFENVFETDHESGQWRHPSGGPYVFIAEQHDRELTTHPILQVADSAQFGKAAALKLSREFEPQHWGVVEAMVLDPDGREISLQAPQ
ncbi:MAG: VOC family protein [Actinomycetia bacterium]|nr:VOC family protein [Actinomycetes bacterium]